MSANLDLVRSIYADWERGDFSHGEWADPEIEFVAADGPSPGTWTGLPEMAEAMGEYVSAFDGLTVEGEDYRELDEERVLVLFRRFGRGKASGLDFSQVRSRGATLLEIHEGKVTKCVAYWDRDRALADLGLED